MLAVGGDAEAWSLRLGEVVADCHGSGRDPRLADTGIDSTVLMFTLAISLVTGILFGIVPAWQVSTGAITGDLSEGNGRGSVGPRAGRTRDALVVAQVAVAIVLLVGAGYLRSFSALTRVDTGIDTKTSSRSTWP